MKRKVSRELETLRQRVEAWRKQDGGGRGSRIPEGLWDEAARIAGTDGLWATSRVLRFNYTRLRERVENTKATKEREQKASSVLAIRGEPKPVGRRSVAGTDPGARFVPLELSALGGTPKTVIDLVSRRGDRMRVEVPAGNVDIVGLCDRFWSAAP